MDIRATDVIYDLNSMNEKQLIQEFKNVCKDIKSKDPDTKLLALQKLKDTRYFTIGGCLVPLIESMVPKKVRVSSSLVFFYSIKQLMLKTIFY